MNSTNGYIYIIYNEMYNFYGDNVYKIGKSYDIYKRISGYTTSYIKPVEIIFLSEECINYTLAEGYIFNKLNEFRLVNNREFFKAPKQTIIDIITTVINDVNKGVITHILSDRKSVLKVYKPIFI